jgi:deoxyribodipyrimidine photo-lyase
LPPVPPLAGGEDPATLLDAVGARPTADPELLPEPGESAARARLDRWLQRGIDDYGASRDQLGDEDGTSRLSQDLRFGLLSAAEVAARASGDGEGRRRYVSELAWRDFYAHVLWHEPRLLRESFRPAMDEAFSRDEGSDAVTAWREGRTGYPVVDAAMRQLVASGWMHNRGRMVAASFLTKHLLVDRRIGEGQFWRHLVDGDHASNNGGWQWAASTGTDPQPYFRIFNPILQGKRFDTDGAYVRRWVPELARVPDEYIQEPWTMPEDAQRDAGCRIGVDYPAPIVDHVAARDRALEALAAAGDPGRRDPVAPDRRDASAVVADRD